MARGSGNFTLTLIVIVLIIGIVLVVGVSLYLLPIRVSTNSTQQVLMQASYCNQSGGQCTLLTTQPLITSMSSGVIVVVIYTTSYTLANVTVTKGSTVSVLSFSSSCLQNTCTFTTGPFTVQSYSVTGTYAIVGVTLRFNQNIGQPVLYRIAIA